MPHINTLAPDFTLPDQNGERHTLSSYRGKWALVYFYPKDDTPGCTKEACVLRDAFPAFQKLDAVIIGISADAEKSHKKFEEKYNLPFILLSDREKIAITAYGVWAPKKFMGREFLGILRTSFLIDPSGKIVKVYENVKPAVHADEVLADLKIFQ